MTTAEAIARSYFAAEERRDLDAVLAHFSVDAELSTPGEDFRGADIARYYGASADTYPGLAVEIGRVFGGGDRCAIEWIATVVDPVGVRRVCRGINAVEVDGKHITSMTVYFDPGQLRDE